MAMRTNFATDDGPAITLLPARPKPSMVDEINHRIANSLQLLSAMVAVEARGIADAASLAALDRMLGRIRAIARVHRQLCAAQAGAVVNLGAYLEELGQDLADGCVDAMAGRRLLVSAADVGVSYEEATSIGIIVSELVANASKYAYAPDAPGDIRVDLRTRPGGGYRLEVSDQGRGLAPNGVPNGAGLGRRLIDMMVMRLGGAHSWRNASPGTRFTLDVDAARGDEPTSLSSKSACRF